MPICEVQLRSQIYGFANKKRYIKKVKKKKPRLSMILLKFAHLFSVTGEDENRLTSPER